MTTYHFMLADSLQKIFPDREPQPLGEAYRDFYALAGERVSFQLAYRMEYDGGEIGNQEVSLELVSELAGEICVRRVELVPSGLAGNREQMDDTYLYTEACLCPDLLMPFWGCEIRPVPYQWRALWFTVDITEERKRKSCPVTLRIHRNGCLLWEDTLCIHTAGACLAQQTLIHTEWFHADCLADYYNVPVFSEEHWRIMEHFVGTAVQHGINMLLTPVFTPPLDTKVGGERTTDQLVGVLKEKTAYRFDFALLGRWIDMCLRQGVRYLEISHLFTQWGAEHAPKIMVREDGVMKRLFGWDTEAAAMPGTQNREDGFKEPAGEYTRFLQQFLPALKQFLRERHMLERTYFHISDEPSDGQRETYAAAQNSVAKLLEDCMVIDALSSFPLYREGIVKHPVVSSDHIQEFLDAGAEELWTYYCCAQGREVSNRFMAIAPARNRILGVQLYLYRIRGFLHWGYNFYNAQFSLYPVNPYVVTDAGGGFPSGDAFVVYPAADGTAYDSIRLEVFTEALYDMRALQTLEQLTDRETVERLIREEAGEEITFRRYPKDAAYIRNLRKKVYEAIEGCGPGTALVYEVMQKELCRCGKEISYDGRVFVPQSNSANGEADCRTVFDYHQKDGMVWAEYSGGGIIRGNLTGTAAADGTLDFYYQHINADRQIRIGKCRSTPVFLGDGRIELHEAWQWLNGDRSQGNSVLIERVYDAAE